MKWFGPNIENSYAELGEAFSTSATPFGFSNPKIIKQNTQLGQSLGFDFTNIDTNQLAHILCGNQIMPQSRPVAMAYAGHQFGHLSILGDGRALLLGEIIDKDNLRKDIHLKGSGPTVYSRGGDGFAGLGPVMREYIISFAMKNLGIPTTESLAIITTGDEIMRDTIQSGAVLTRIAASHIRVGTFTYFGAKSLPDELKKLADYSIARHYSEIIDGPDKYLNFLYSVMARQANLVAQWMAVGFIHGVMNTDNMTISGETIDYGPCAFMDYYDPNKVYSSIDKNGRYKYNNQPNIAIWNLARFAESLMPLFNEDENIALEMAQTAIDSFGETYKKAWLKEMRPKFGLSKHLPEDETLINQFLSLLAQYKLDFTNSFRALCNFDLPHESAFSDWNTEWQNRLSQETYSNKVTRQIMRAKNPAIIARNHQVQMAIAAGENGDFTPMDALLDALAHPFEDTNQFNEYKNPPHKGEEVTKTFCGT